MTFCTYFVFRGKNSNLDNSSHNLDTCRSDAPNAGTPCSRFARTEPWRREYSAK